VRIDLGWVGLGFEFSRRQGLLGRSMDFEHRRDGSSAALEAKAP
jgi:hypothetical protein